jgi:hypothetical protein
MAEEMPDGRFKSEVMILLGNLINKADETTSSLENVRTDINSLSADVKVLSKQFNEVGLMSIKDHSRIDDVEERLSILEGEVH